MTTSSRLVPMRPRDPAQEGRTASTLELFFDLVFVVAVSIAAVDLAHELAEGHVVHGVGSFALIFFAIWWAWMNFTWFATAFDTDDWLYRVVTFVQMAGVLVLAAGIEDVFAEGDLGVVVIGYVIMRLAMVSQWLRAARGAGDRRRVALTYAGGITVVQILWGLNLLLPEDVRPITIVILILAEISVPAIAERRIQTPWHPHHITERYGLFTLILLGESLLASANAIIEARQEEAELGPLIALAVLAFVVTAALWWIYFWPPHHRAIGGYRESLRYGYVHYFVFAGAAAFSAGVEVEVGALTHHSELSDVAASFTVTIPIAIFLIGIWWIAIRANADRVVNVVVPLGAVVVLLDPVLPLPIALTAIVMVLIVVVLVVRPPLPAPSPRDS